jgi:hypothetical protein
VGERSCKKQTQWKIIRVITKLPNSEQSFKGKVKTHNYINRKNQSTTGKRNRGLMMLVFYAFLDVSLYVQGVNVIPAYSFPRQKKVHPKTTHPSIMFNWSVQASYRLKSQTKSTFILSYNVDIALGQKCSYAWLGKLPRYL